MMSKSLPLMLVGLLVPPAAQGMDSFPGRPTNDPEGGQNKVTICHLTGNPDKCKTIEVSEAALETHLDHGDFEGECTETCEPLDCPCFTPDELDDLDWPDGDHVCYKEGEWTFIVTWDDISSQNGNGFAVGVDQGYNFCVLGNVIGGDPADDAVYVEDITPEQAADCQLVITDSVHWANICEQESD